MIKIKLKLINITKNTKEANKEITEEFFVCDIKAHTFAGYPYPSSINRLSTKTNGHYESESVKGVRITPSLKHGMVQTGIRYPNAYNPLVVARKIDEKNPTKDINNIDYSMIEFCGGNVTDFGKFQDYELVSIKTNYEKTTRGKLYGFKTGKEKVEKS